MTIGLVAGWVWTGRKRVMWMLGHYCTLSHLPSAKCPGPDASQVREVLADMHKKENPPLLLTMRMRLCSPLWGSRARTFPRTRIRAAFHSKAPLRYNFSLEKVRAIPELGLEGSLFRHGPSGATLVHLGKTDKNCVFSLGFRTFPTDSTGAPHILEHLALCGSRRYPVRDPFFKMLNRSLATYMNAWTASDWTMYPFSTQHPVDYANLRDIYVDATLSPLLAEADFRQEGWRLERVEDPQSVGQWSLTGVVYNEMKGAFSDNETLFSQLHQQSLLEGSIYGNVSGGHPRDIPRLSHDELLQFWRTHYHPANCLAVSYGDVAAFDEHLAYLDRAFDQARHRSGAFPGLRRPLDGLRRHGRPRRVVVKAGAVDPLGDPRRQVKLLVSFLCNPLADLQTKFNMKVLASLLLDGPASPFHQSLIDSNIGSEYAAGTGYDSSSPLTSLSVGLQGISEEDVERVEALIMNTFREARVGKHFSQDRIDAVLHQIELGLCYHSANFGLGLAQRSTSAWVHDLCPLEELEVSQRIATFKAQVAAGGLFESLLDQYVLGNPDQLTFIMKPEAEYQKRAKEAESLLVQTLVDRLGEEDLRTIDRKNQELRTAQEQKANDKHLLPCLALSDLKREIIPMPFQITTGPAGWTIYSRITDKANGLGYFRAKIPIVGPLGDEEVALLPLMTACLTELGVTSIPIDEFDRRVRSTCAGLAVSIHQERRGGRGEEARLALVLSTHALRDNLERTFELFQRAVMDTNWEDLSRLRTQLAAMVSSMSNGIAASGHVYARSRAAAKLSEHHRVSELLGGLEQLDFLNKLLEEEADDLRPLSCRLRALARKVLVRGDISLALVADEDVVLRRLEAGARIIEGFHDDGQSTSGSSSVRPTAGSRSLREMTVTPFSTNFVAHSFLVDPDNRQESANLAILARLLPPLHLHKEIREKGGAYGGGASFSRLDGLFTAYSYRDPTPQRTLHTIHGIGEWLRHATLTEQDLLEAQLSVFSDLDAPQDASSEGMQHFLHKVTDDERQEYRDALLGVTVESVRRVGERYFVDKAHGAGPMVTSTAVLIEAQHEADLRSRGFALRGS